MGKVRAMIKNQDGTYAGYIYGNNFDLFFNQKSYNQFRKPILNEPDNGIIFFFLSADVKNDVDGTLIECKVFGSPFWWVVLLMFVAVLLWQLYLVTQGGFNYAFFLIPAIAYIVLVSIYNVVRILFVGRVLNMFDAKIVK